MYALDVERDALQEACGLSTQAFWLPPGAFATSVLREIVDTSDES